MDAGVLDRAHRARTGWGLDVFCQNRRGGIMAHWFARSHHDLSENGEPARKSAYDALENHTRMETRRRHVDDLSRLGLGIREKAVPVSSLRRIATRMWSVAIFKGTEARTVIPGWGDRSRNMAEAALMVRRSQDGSQKLKVVPGFEPGFREIKSCLQNPE